MATLINLKAVARQLRDSPRWPRGVKIIDMDELENKPKVMGMASETLDTTGMEWATKRGIFSALVDDVVDNILERRKEKEKFVAIAWVEVLQRPELKTITLKVVFTWDHGNLKEKIA